MPSESCPAGKSKFARDGQLCVTKAQMGVEDLGVSDASETRMKFSDPLGRSRIARSVLPQQVFGLIPEMIEVGARWKASCRHGELPFLCPRSALTGRKQVRRTELWVIRWTSVLSADRKRPFRAAVIIPRENSTRVRVNRPLCRQLSDGRATEEHGTQEPCLVAMFSDCEAGSCGLRQGRSKTEWLHVRTEGGLWVAAVPLLMGSAVLLHGLAFFRLPTGYYGHSDDHGQLTTPFDVLTISSVFTSETKISLGPFDPREFKNMTVKRLFFFSGVFALLASVTVLNAQQPEGEGISIGNDDIGGVVASTRGPEGGVWVIAETTELPTKFVRIVVTDDRGRYLVPQLPGANYKVWARGYGLVDSPPVPTTPGKIVNLTALVAPNARAAAEYYPAIYWFSLLQVPQKNEFPGTGPKGNGIPETAKNQGQWLHLLKTDSCWACHQLGDKATREIPNSLGYFDSTTAAWSRRLLSGQAGNNMINGLAQLGPERALKTFADWTDRIAAG